MTLEIEPPSGIAIRPARSDDYVFARMLYVESMAPLLKALGRWDEVALAERFDNAYLSQPSQVICKDDIDIGWLQVSRRTSSVHLDQVHLVEAYRNREIGSRLVRAIMQGAAGQGLSVGLNVIRGNRAIELYCRLGFRVVEEDEELLRMRWDPPPPERS